MANIVPSEASIEIIGSALRGDPFAPDLTRGLAEHYAQIGAPEISALILNKFHALAPNAKGAP
jgi:hypothetical protein